LQETAKLQKYRRKYESRAIRAIPVPQQGRSALRFDAVTAPVPQPPSADASPPDPPFHCCLQSESRYSLLGLPHTLLGLPQSQRAMSLTLGEPRRRARGFTAPGATVRASHKRSSPQHVSDHGFRDGLAARQQQQRMLRGARAGSGTRFHCSVIGNNKNPS